MAIDFAKIAADQEWERIATPEQIAERDFQRAARITDRTPGVIAGFNGGYRFLSNYSDYPVRYDGLEYRSGEHAFAAAKTLDPEQRIEIHNAGSPGAAKRYGRSVTLRPDWDSVVRYEAMDEIVRSKADLSTHWRDHLLRTEDDLLVERTSWHDQEWGWCDCAKHRSWPGKNHLGRTLMRVRSELRGDAPTRWVRVMATGHRPQHLKGDQRIWATEQLRRVAAKLIAEHGMRVAIHGGAIGTDLAWARAAHAAGVDALWSYLPFPQQPARWDEAMRKRWEHVTALREDGGLSTRTEFLADVFSNAALHGRNDWMIRDADAVVAVHDPDKATGGTAAALRKIGTSLPVIHINPRDRTVKILNRPQVNEQSAVGTTTPPTTVVHVREPHDVRIDRTGKWGNPFVIGRDGDRATVIAKHRAWVITQPDLMAALPELRGKRLGCHCKPNDCHGDTLAELADRT